MVLSVLAYMLERTRKKPKRNNGILKFVNFVRAAEYCRILADASRTCHELLAVTNQGGVIVIWSSSSEAAADPGISEGGAVEGRGSGGCLEGPSGSRAKPWWDSRGQSHRKLTNSCMQKAFFL
jgi:hypothetical protein